MKNKTCTILFLVAGLILLAGLLAPMATAREGVWRADRASPAAAPRLGTEVQISTPSTPTDADRYKPAVAYNYINKEYLVVWHNTWPSGHRDIYAQRVSRTGQLVGPWFAISAGPNDRLQPAVAYNHTNNEYLVVWMYDISGNGSRYEIRGRTIAWNGSYMNSEQVIGNWSAPYNMWSPSVAWNSYRNEYLVIWDTFNQGNPPTSVYGIGYRFVSASGTPGSGALPITANSPHQSDIVYNIALDGYMVVWVRVYSSATTGDDIYGAFLDHNGAIITPPGEFAIHSGPSDQRLPAVTTNEQAHYIVVWQHFDNSYIPGDWDIHGQLFYANGNPASGEFGISPTYDDETNPDVAANGAAQQYLTVWQKATGGGTNIVARLRNSNGTLSAPVDVAAWAFWNNESPAVAADIPGFLVAYEGDSTTPGVYRHIYGRMYWPEAVYLPAVLRNYP